MQEDNSFFDLNGGQLEEIQDKYALLEPLVDTYLSESEKREYSRQVCAKLCISERTLRRYLQRFREDGIYTLIRKKRSDAGVLRVFSDEILKKALQLLEQNSSRSIPMLMKLLETDEQIASQVRNIPWGKNIHPHCCVAMDRHNWNPIPSSEEDRVYAAWSIGRCGARWWT